ncbi:MAG TPA: general secretion pathway protein GspB [Steroidobacteraceae bacterium]
MSFILDALRKSEHDRQRQTGPALAEVPVAPRKAKSNVWATVAIALLIVNLIGVGVLLLRRASHETPPATTTASTTTPTAAPAPAPSAPVPSAPAASAPVQATPVATPAAGATTATASPQPTLQPSAAPTAPAGRNPLEAEVTGGRPDIDAGMAASAASVPAGPPAVSRTPSYGSTGGGSVRYESIPQDRISSAIAAETRALPPPAAPSQPALPSADELIASGGVPPLHLDLHVFSNRPQERFIFVNSHKYREGDALQEGPTVEQITPTGAVLSYRGSRFLLTR